jgi:hypothetical protein
MMVAFDGAGLVRSMGAIAFLAGALETPVGVAFAVPDSRSLQRAVLQFFTHHVIVGRLVRLCG